MTMTTDEGFRVGILICAVIIAGALLGGVISIGVDLHDLAEAHRAIRRCP